MLCQQPVDLGDPKPLGCVALQPLEATCRPQLAAFGFEVLAIEIDHAPLWAGCAAKASGDATYPERFTPRRDAARSAVLRGAYLLGPRAWTL